MPTAVLDQPLDLAECESCSTRTSPDELIHTADAEELCASCASELDLCQACDRPARAVEQTVDDEDRCFECRSGFSECDDCARYTSEITAIISGGDVCGDCAAEYSTCDDCNSPAADSVSINGDHWVCPDCRDDYSRCHECEMLFRGCEYYCEGCTQPNPSRVYDSCYKPDPDFHGLGPLFLGLELEVRTSYDGYGDSVETANNRLDSLGYLKDDASISCGFELVTHPMSFDYAMNQFPWSLLSQLRLLGCYTDDDVGIHIHLSRAGFDSPAHIYRWLKLIYRNEPAVTTLARRRYSEWASFDPDVRAMAKDLAHGDHGWGRYHAVNAHPTETFELRVFASSLKPQQVKAALAFAHASVEYTRGLRSPDIARGGWDWSAFTTWVSARPEYTPLTAELAALTATGAFTTLEEAYPCAS
ncbi:amidoligase family protein [Nocardia asteroides]